LAPVCVSHLPDGAAYFGRLGDIAPHRLEGNVSMQDLVWIGAAFGLLAATLAYVRLCDNA
jgi:hypothetical protein